MTPLTCPYCGGKAPLQSTTIIYQGKYFGLAYICENYPKCDAYIGVHKDSGKPLGRLANKELRTWKTKAHEAFDQLWKKNLVNIRKKRGSNYKQVYAKKSSYKWLCEKLGIEAKDCHIGMFDVDMCKSVVEVCASYLKSNGL